MGKIKVRHLIEKPSGFYFQPSKSMKLAGFHNESLGRDAGAAVVRAEELNHEWDQVRAGLRDAPSAPAPPAGTMARLAYDLQRSRAIFICSGRASSLLLSRVIVFFPQAIEQPLAHP